MKAIFVPRKDSRLAAIPTGTPCCCTLTNLDATTFLPTLILLLASNIFMTFAWYGHLKHKESPIWAAIIVSWLIAFVEYCFQVPANRLGHQAGVSAAQLKTMQEVITLCVFAVFSVVYLNEPLRWNYLAGFVLIALGALLVFAPWEQATAM